MTVTLEAAVDMLRRWKRHHDRQIRSGTTCDSFNACDDMDTDTGGLLREYAKRPRPNCPSCGSELHAAIGQSLPGPQFETTYYARMVHAHTQLVEYQFFRTPAGVQSLAGIIGSTFYQRSRTYALRHTARPDNHWISRVAV